MCQEPFWHKPIKREGKKLWCSWDCWDWDTNECAPTMDLWHFVMEGE